MTTNFVFEIQVKIRMIELIYIGAVWCTTCKTIKPALVELCKKFSVTMKSFDYDNDLEEEEKETITKVPTVRICEDGKMVAEFNVQQVKSTEAWCNANIKFETTEDF